MQCSHCEKSELPIKSQVGGLEAFPLMSVIYDNLAWTDPWNGKHSHLKIPSLPHLSPLFLWDCFWQNFLLFFLRKGIPYWFFLEPEKNSTVSWKTSLKFEACNWHHSNLSSSQVSLLFPFTSLCSSQVIRMFSFALKHPSWTFICASHAKFFWEIVWE